MNILLLDNYDSFTYNLAQIIEENIDGHLDIVKNDEMELENAAKYDAIILSPGPGLPKEAGIMPQLIEKYHNIKPILGVCLGHQAIAEYFGATLFNSATVFHGISTDTEIIDLENIMFQDIESPFQAGRYHSWAVSEDNFPRELVISARSSDNIIMAFRHRSLPIFGVQFHPESYMTSVGNLLLRNFLKVLTD